MPGTGRVVLPDYSHHVVQRGHNRQVVFAQGDDLGNFGRCKAPMLITPHTQNDVKK